jgi:hypothetical protein
MIAHIYTPTLFDICNIDIHGLFDYFFLFLIFSHRISWVLNHQETQTNVPIPMPSRSRARNVASGSARCPNSNGLGPWRADALSHYLRPISLLRLGILYAEIDINIYTRIYIYILKENVLLIMICMSTKS